MEALIISNKDYVFAGKSIFTLVSNKTGVRYTYKVQVAKNDTNMFFCKLLTGADNTSSYTYIGFLLKEDMRLRITKASKYKEDSICVKALQFFLNNVKAGVLHKDLEFLKSNSCCRCGRLLTTPEAIKDGIGSECKKFVYGKTHRKNG